MPEIQIRPVETNDLPYLIKIEQYYMSHFVWQMDRLVEDGQIIINFRQSRLPRPVRVDYAGSRPLLDEHTWTQYLAVLVATIDQMPVGYVGVSEQLVPRTLWVTDCAVREDCRRKGIGTTLIMAAQEWGGEHNYRKVILEMQSKNHPAIQMAHKLGYEFCGYNDNYFPSQDIALFFSRSLR
jgi:ribosomal protein S18 acetylase RimI-like enzyme